MDMSNKTSDNNVANIERLNSFANMTFLYGNRVNLNVSGLKEIQNDIKNILLDYTRQKQINEEHQKLNGELREKVKELEEKNKHLSNASDYETISLECTNLEEQLEIANDRIKELEEESKENKKKYLALLLSQFPDTTETYKKYKEELQELLEGGK